MTNHYVLKEQKELPKSYTPFMIYVIDIVCCYSCNTCFNNIYDYYFNGKKSFKEVRKNIN